MDEAGLLEKLFQIEALHVGSTSEGERAAARLAAERVRARLAAAPGREHDVELIDTLPDPCVKDGRTVRSGVGMPRKNEACLHESLGRPKDQDPPAGLATSG